MNIYEETAVGQFLSYWDDSLSYDDIITKLNDDDFELVSVWQPLEDYPSEFIIECIVNLKSSLEYNFPKGVINNEKKLIQKQVSHLHFY